MTSDYNLCKCHLSAWIVFPIELKCPRPWFLCQLPATINCTAMYHLVTALAQPHTTCGPWKTQTLTAPRENFSSPCSNCSFSKRHPHHTTDLISFAFSPALQNPLLCFTFCFLQYFSLHTLLSFSQIFNCGKIYLMKISSLTLSKCIVHSHCCIPNIQNYFHLAKLKLHPHSTLIPHSPSPQLITTISLLSASMNLTPLATSYAQILTVFVLL